MDSGGEDGTGRWGIVNIYVRTRRTGRPVAWRTNLLLLKIVESINAEKWGSCQLGLQVS